MEKRLKITLKVRFSLHLVMFSVDLFVYWTFASSAGGDVLSSSGHQQ